MAGCSRPPSAREIGAILQLSYAARRAVLRSGPGALARQFGQERTTEGGSQSIDLR